MQNRRRTEEVRVREREDPTGTRANPIPATSTETTSGRTIGRFKWHRDGRNRRRRASQHAKLPPSLATNQEPDPTATTYPTIGRFKWIGGSAERSARRRNERSTVTATTVTVTVGVAAIYDDWLRSAERTVETKEKAAPERVQVLLPPVGVAARAADFGITATLSSPRQQDQHEEENRNERSGGDCRVKVDTE